MNHNQATCTAHNPQSSIHIHTLTGICGDVRVRWCAHCRPPRGAQKQLHDFQTNTTMCVLVHGALTLDVCVFSIHFLYSHRSGLRRKTRFLFFFFFVHSPTIIFSYTRLYSRKQRIRTNSLVPLSNVAATSATIALQFSGHLFRFYSLSLYILYIYRWLMCAFACVSARQSQNIQQYKFI